MCIGLPMTVTTGDEVVATVEGMGETRVVSALLVGALSPGTAVLVHHNAIVRVLDPDEVEPIRMALRALTVALDGGGDVDALFPDLAGREPPLPEHLRPGRPKETP